MAMESVNRFYQILKALIVIGLFSQFLGCASNSPQTESSAKKTQKAGINKTTDSPKVLVSTLQHIPKRTVDEKTGLLLPYQSATNPYLQKSGQIEAPLVVEFIAARRAYQSSNYKKAKKTLEDLTSNDNSLSGPWVMLGDIALNNKKAKQAMQNYQKAITINKNNVNAYIRLAKVQRLQGDFIAAQNTYNQALSIWKDFPEAHLNLAILYDIYLNKQILSQRHLEAYLFLVDGRDKKQVNWLTKLQQRTGKDIQLKVDIRKAVSNTSS